MRRIVLFFSLVIGLLLASASAQAASFRSVSSTLPDQVVVRDAPMWSNPYRRGNRVIGSTDGLVHSQLVVHPVQTVISHYGPLYTSLAYTGRYLGWTLTSALRTPRSIELPFEYTSQFWPSPASDACEVASLKMALSVKGKALRVPLRKMVGRIPRSRSPYRGYTHNPYRLGSGASIYPGMLSEVARRYGVHAHRILPRHATAGLLKWYVIHGDPVVFEGSHRMLDTRSDHVLVLLGYRPGYFFWADPESYRSSYWCTGWTRIGQFMRTFSRPLRARRAMVVSY